MIVFLIGYMGSGKSTVGRTLAKRAGLRFVDMDKAIEQKSGMTVSEMFAGEGEGYFRKCEKEFIEGLADSKDSTDLVVATGGGAPCFGDNMDMMNRVGVTIYLKMSPKRLLDRLRHGREKRPLIREMDDEQLMAFIEHNLTLRKPFYEQASATIACDGVSDEYIGVHIEEMLNVMKNGCVNIQRQQ